MTERHENELARLDVLIGKGINKGVTVPPDGAATDEILTSDVYERRPGGRLVLHTAYGRVGDRHVGGTKIIGYDAASAEYRSYFFDSLGDFRTSRLTVAEGVWTWLSEKARAAAEFTDAQTQVP